MTVCMKGPAVQDYTHFRCIEKQAVLEDTQYKKTDFNKVERFSGKQQYQRKIVWKKT